MATRQREIEGIGLVNFSKRKNSRSIRIHISGENVTVTLPSWVAYNVAERFVKTRSQWISENRSTAEIITHGSIIGKNHTIAIDRNNKSRTRIKNNTLHVSLPENEKIESIESQAKLKKASHRVLKHECEQLITPRLQDLSLEYGFEYKNVTYKRLKSRWGSCDNASNLVFNIYLVQLPWRLIDYVIIHELSHTQHHNHSAAFWKDVEKCLPNYKDLRQEVKAFQPSIIVI